MEVIGIATHLLIENPTYMCQVKLSTLTSLQRATFFGKWQNLQVPSLYCYEVGFRLDAATGLDLEQMSVGYST